MINQKISYGVSSSVPFARWVFVCLWLVAVTSNPLLASDVLFHETFAGVEGDPGAPLHGTTPDIALGDATWAAAEWLADGTIETNTSSAADHSAFLPFVPLPGNIYTLSATMTQPTGGLNSGWVAIGFTGGQTTTGEFWANDAAPWMLWRPSDATSANEVASFLGPQTAGMASLGTATNTATLRLVLNTQDEAWTAEWFINNASARLETHAANPTITHIGFSRENGQRSIFSDFSLTVEGDHPPPPPPPPPPEPIVTFIPVTDGNSATDENGYAGSAINAFAYAQDNLITVSNQQFISYYRRHATDSAHPDNNTVLIGRRNLGEAVWEIFTTDFTSVDIDDTHNVISMAIDGDGVLHMAWGVHGHALRYAKSNASVLGDAPIVMTRLDTAGMTGQEQQVTYPKFQTLPSGDVVFLYREGGSGNGDWFLHRYNRNTATWSPIHTDANGVTQPLFQGRDQTPNNCFYPDRMTLGPDGMLHLSGVFRYNTGSPAGESGFQTNHRYVYLRSPDGGTTWQRSDGSPIALPVVNNASFRNLGTNHVAEIVEDIPEGHSLMNQSGMTTDSAGRPIIANWWALDAASGDHTRQYHIFFHDGTAWHRRTVSARDIDPATKIPENQLRNHRMGRPLVIADANDRIIVLYNDNRFDGITAVFSLPLAQDPERNHWTRVNLTHENLGIWENTYDEDRWNRDGVLHMLYQKLPGIGMDYSGQNHSTPVAVVEWDAHAYFNGPTDWVVDTHTSPGEASVVALTQVGFRYDLLTNTEVDFSVPPISTFAGDGRWHEFEVRPMNEPMRFWTLQRTEEATNDL